MITQKKQVLKKTTYIGLSLFSLFHSLECQAINPGQLEEEVCQDIKSHKIVHRAISIQNNISKVIQVTEVLSVGATILCAIPEPITQTIGLTATVGGAGLGIAGKGIKKCVKEWGKHSLKKVPLNFTSKMIKKERKIRKFLKKLEKLEKGSQKYRRTKNEIDILRNGFEREIRVRANFLNGDTEFKEKIEFKNSLLKQKLRYGKNTHLIKLLIWENNVILGNPYSLYDIN